MLDWLRSREGEGSPIIHKRDSAFGVVRDVFDPSPVFFRHLGGAELRAPFSMGTGDMARKKTPTVRVHVKASLSRRLRELRQELFGDHGGPELARRLELPARTWYNYETGVTVPAEVLLAFIEQTGANPSYLLTGEGPRYSQSDDGRLVADLSPVELIRRGLEKLERSPSPPPLDGRVDGIPENFETVRVVPIAALCNPPHDLSIMEEHVLTYPQWLPNPSRTIAARLDDDSMAPILPTGSIVAIDRSSNHPMELQGKIVAACVEGQPMIRWLDVSGHHLILRPNQPGGVFPLVPIDLSRPNSSALLGRVVWSWSRFDEE